MMVSFIQSNLRRLVGDRHPWDGDLIKIGSAFPDHSSQLCRPRQAAFIRSSQALLPREEARLNFGVMGGHMQHQGHVQMVCRIFDFGQNPQEASDAPRWHVYPDLKVGLEQGIPQAVFDDLKGGDIMCHEGQEACLGAQPFRHCSGYVGGRTTAKRVM